MSVPHHHFRGSHYGVGHQMGRAFASDVHAALRRLANYPPPLPPEQVQHSVALAMQITRQTFPEVLQEIEGMADGAGVSVSDLFLDLYEELVTTTTSDRLTPRSTQAARTLSPRAQPRSRAARSSDTRTTNTQRKVSRT